MGNRGTTPERGARRGRRSCVTRRRSGREGVWRRKGVIEKNEPLDEEIMKQNDSTADGSSSKWRREKAAAGRARYGRGPSEERTKSGRLDVVCRGVKRGCDDLRFSVGFRGKETVRAERRRGANGVVGGATEIAGRQCRVRDGVELNQGVCRERERGRSGQDEEPRRKGFGFSQSRLAGGRGGCDRGDSRQNGRRLQPRGVHGGWGRAGRRIRGC